MNAKETDEELMAQVAQGDLDVLRTLFDRHHLYVFNFLHKMSADRMLSEDLTQDVFYKVIKYRSSYNGGKFVSWLFTIARNSLKTHFTRHAEKHADLEQVEFQLEKETPKADYSDLQRALNRLEAEDREIIIMNRFQEMRYQEIAEIMGSTEGAIKTKACRALKKLKTLYLQSL